MNNNDEDTQKIMAAIVCIVAAKTRIREATPAARLAAVRAADDRAAEAARAAFSAAARAEASLWLNDADANDTDANDTDANDTEARNALMSSIVSTRRAGHKANAAAAWLAATPHAAGSVEAEITTTITAMEAAISTALAAEAALDLLTRAVARVERK